MSDREDAPRPRLSERLHERRQRHLERGRLYRIAVVVAGFIILSAGIAMLALPGPALVVIPIGLALLALEFAWAERMLEKALDRAELAKQKAAQTSTAQRVLSGLAAALGVAAFVVAALLWDIPLLPV